ncbi:MAG: polysaccharide deacetylase family protein [Pseudobdellovibrionaceae bacterium]
MARKLFLTLLFILSPELCYAAPTVLDEDKISATVYVYFRIGDEERQTPGISLKAFEEHIASFTMTGDLFHPTKLSDIFDAFDKKEPLPAGTINLTFEGNDYSFFTNAFPLLEKNKIYFTLFVSPGSLDQASTSSGNNKLTWDNVRTIAQSPYATIGLTSYSYNHQENSDTVAIKADLNRSLSRFREEMGTEPLYFSYPFGEFSTAFRESLKNYNFKAVFAQNSGIVSPLAPRDVLPRFTVTDEFADVERMISTSRALPLPVIKSNITGTALTQNPPDIEIELDPRLTPQDIKTLSCYASGIGTITPTRDNTNTIKIKFSEGYKDTKGRLNCTMVGTQPEDGDIPQWRWLGFQFTLPEELITH